MPVYLDHAATTPIRPEVLEEYTAALRTVGNPSSIHGPGQAARALLEDARARIGAALGADPMEVVLTAGGTESVNLAVKGLFWRGARDGRRRVVVPLAEHHATLDAVDWLEQREGAEVVRTGVDALGRARVDEIADALARQGGTAVVTALQANNEVGTLQPVAELAALAAEHGVPLHLDAIAALGQVPVDLAASGASAISISGHKIGAPVGVGALLLRRDVEPEALLHGGAQQRARSGTLDAAGAAALALAVETAVAELDAHAAHLAALRDRLMAGLAARVPEATVRGDTDPAGRLPGNVHLTVAGAEGDSLLFLLDRAGYAVSTGSACQAGVPEVSHVLRAMGLPDAEARGALRITLGRETTAADVDGLLDALVPAVATARSAGLAERIPTLGR
jgi:cysteine desulfurase